MAMGVPVVVNRGWGDVDSLIPRPLLVDDFSDLETQRVLDHILDNHRDETPLSNGYVSLAEGVERYASVYHAMGVHMATVPKI